MSTINLIGITLLVIFLVFIIGKKPKSNPDKLLIIVIALLAAYLLANIWVTQDINEMSFIALNILAASLFFPFTVYVLLLIDPGHRLKKRWIWLALFDISFITYLLVDIFLLDRTSSIGIERLYTHPPLDYLIFFRAHSIYKITVLSWLIFKINKYQELIRKYYSNLDGISIPWLKVFVAIYLGENVVSSILFLFYNYGHIQQIEIPYLITNTGLIISMFYVIYKGIKHYTLASFPTNEIRVDRVIDKPKYGTSSLSEAQMKVLFTQITLLFEKEHIYHDPELKVIDLAKKLGVTAHNISQTLNTLAQESFYEFVNAYRINYFKELLSDPTKRKYTILALGLESGFNSKASLNRVFKQQMGVTPKAYQQQAQSA
jgi:AraC-like DNA-binding protein